MEFCILESIVGVVLIFCLLLIKLDCKVSGLVDLDIVLVGLMVVAMILFIPLSGVKC